MNNWSKYWEYYTKCLALNGMSILSAPPQRLKYLMEEDTDRMLEEENDEERVL